MKRIITLLRQSTGQKVYYLRRLSKRTKRHMRRLPEKITKKATADTSYSSIYWAGGIQGGITWYKGLA